MCIRDRKSTVSILKTHELKSNADLIKSVDWIVKDNVITLVANDYFESVDTGRRKGAKMINPQDLIPWMKKNGISPRGNMSYNTLAFIIANSIKKNGIKGKLFTTAIIEAATDIIAEELAVEISENICNELVAAIEN